MKRYLLLSVVLLAGLAGLIFIQHEHVGTRASPTTLLMAAADAQNETVRLPLHLDRMTDSDEIALGKEMADRTSVSFGTLRSNSPHDAAVQAYLQEVGSRVAAHSRRHLPWTFHYIPSPSFANAFALPGGQVFVGEGLIRLMESEDALAAVLGHEIEHDDLRHCAERAQTEARLHQLGGFGELAGLPAEVFMAGYGKEQETEADRDGTVLAVEAGYSYTGILQLLNAFSKLENGGENESSRSGGPLGEAAHLSLEALGGYLASHPPSEMRREDISNLAREHGWRSHSVVPLRLI